MKKSILLFALFLLLACPVCALGATDFEFLPLYINGEQQGITAHYTSGEPLLPLRETCEMLGAGIEYNTRGEICISSNGDIYTITPGSATVTRNGEFFDTLSAAPYIENWKTYLTYKDISLILGVSIKWNITQTVEIQTDANEGALEIVNGVLTGYSGAASKLDLSAYTEIKEIGESAFAGNEDLTEIILPTSLEKIWAFAFSDCSNLSKVIIPDSVKEIGGLAFFQCSSLQTLRLPESLIKIETQTFLRSGIKELIVPPNVQSIGSFVFNEYPNADVPLERIVIPPSVTKISDSAFLWGDNVVIEGLSGSYAETYAKEGDIPFKALSEEELEEIIENR